MQPIQVSVDGMPVGSPVSPTSTSFASFSVAITLATSGTHTITFGGTTGGDKSTFIDDVKSAAGSPPPGGTLVNPSFESPALGGSYQYNPTAAGVGWSFAGGSGIQGNGSAWGAAAAPAGTQTAFIQSTGTISQSLSLTAGSYTLSFKAAQRSCCVSPYVQPIQVSVDGTPVGNPVAPTSTAFTSFSIAFSIATGGTHTITFTGTSGSDRTTFIDSVALASAGVTTTTALATSGTPSTVGANVTFTATVNGAAPTGSVAFKDGGNAISGCGAVALPAGSANAKVATCSTSSLNAATHSIVATYAGDAGNNGSTSATLSQVVNGGGGGGTDVVWIDDSLPAGAIADGDEAWTWVASNPTPFSGTKAHRSPLRSGEHQHYFYNATTTLNVGVGDSLFAYVYLDPVTPPSEVMLQWYDGTSWNRAYWGANQIAWGTNGTASLRFMGALPPKGQWVRLTVPAAQVGMEGHVLTGMAFTLYGGKAFWDRAGKHSGP